MSLSLWETDRKLKIEKLATYILGAIVLFYVAICTPLYHLFHSNIVISQTILPQLWDILMYLTSFMFYWGAFAFLIHLLSRYSLAECKRFLKICGLCLLARYILSYAIGCLMLMEAPVWADLWQFLFEILMDLIQFGAAIYAAFVFIGRKREACFDPRSRLFSFGDRFHLCGVILAAIPSAFKLLSRIRYDLFYGFPQSIDDLLGMIFWYALDIVSVLLGYFVICWLLSELTIKEKEAELLEKK